MLRAEERERLKVLHEVRRGHLRQRQAAAELGLSVRWVKELVRRLREVGDRAVVHGLRGRASNRRIGAEVKEKALRLLREHHRDYGPTLASEVLAEELGLKVSRETVRKWLVEAGLWRPKRAKLKRMHGWRARRERRGELVQWDTSEHDWLEGRGAKLYLIAMIDDATSELTARFARSDSTAENLELLGEYLQRHGRPLEFYTDKASLFVVNRPLHYNKHLPGEAPKTQIGRALEELGIGWIGAHSPQAKGRIERCFGTLQDRLVKALRRAGVCDLAGANRYLREVYLPEWNRRWRQAPACEADAHRPLRADQRLDSILSHVESRQVGNDYTVSWHGRKFQIPLAEAQPRMRGQRVRVEQRRNGELWAVWRGREIRLQECVQRPAPVVAAAPVPAPKVPGKPQTRRRWMDGFWIGDPAKRRPSPVTPVALRAPSVTGDP